MRVLRVLAAVICAGTLCLCTDGGRDVAGTNVETSTGKPAAAIAGLVLYRDSSAAADVDVTLHDRNTIRMTVLGKRQAGIRSGETRTNINGFFRFDTVDTGDFLVEFNDHDTLGAVEQARVDQDDTLVIVNAQLQRFGAVRGYVDSSSLTDCTYVTIPDINRRALVDSNGYFEISGVPPWEYELRMMRGDSVARVPGDTTAVPVSPADTTRIDRLGSPGGMTVTQGTVVDTPDTPGYRYYRFLVESMGIGGNAADGGKITESHFLLDGVAYPPAGHYELVSYTETTNSGRMPVLFDGDSTTGSTTGDYVTIDRSDHLPWEWVIDMKQNYVFDSFFYAFVDPWYYKVPDRVKVFGADSQTGPWVKLHSATFTFSYGTKYVPLAY